MSLSFCNAFGGLLSPALGLAAGVGIASKITAGPGELAAADLGADPGAQAADGGALCTTDEGSYESTAGGGAGEAP